MARKTAGTLFKRGKSQNYYLRYYIGGKQNKVALRDEAGNPITRADEARKAAEALLAPLKATDKAQQIRAIANELRTAEDVASEAARSLQNSRATIRNGWCIFMECPKRPASCKRYPVDEIPRHTTAANYRSYYERFMAWMANKHPDIRLLSEVTPELAAAFMEAIRLGGASGTFNKYLQFFNCFFDTVNQAGKVNTHNPFTDIDRAEVQYNSKKPLTVEQIAKLIDTAAGDLRLLVALGYFTGLRLGDCCTLEWREVDLLRGIIERIPRKTAHTVKDKMQAAVKIGIAPFLYDMLAAIPESERNGFVLQKFAEKYLAGGDQQIVKKLLKHFIACGIEIHRPGTGRTIAIDSKNGEPIIDKRTGKPKKTGCRAVVEVGFHSLRYSYVSHNAEAGTPAAIIQRNAGHASPAMTEHYTRISDAAAVKYASALQLSTSNPESPERAELHRLADTLPVEKILELLAMLK